MLKQIVEEIFNTTQEQFKSGFGSVNLTIYLSPDCECKCLADPDVHKYMDTYITRNKTICGHPYVVQVQSEDFKIEAKK